MYNVSLSMTKDWPIVNGEKNDYCTTTYYYLQAMGHCIFMYCVAEISQIYSIPGDRQPGNLQQE